VVEIKQLSDLRLRKKMEKRSGASIKSKHFEGKITESYIENKRKRQKVRNERKRTLFKKAKQLHLMTGSDVWYCSKMVKEYPPTSATKKSSKLLHLPFTLFLIRYVLFLIII